MEYIQENHLEHDPITPETIIFTEYNENLKLINVGYAQKDALTAQDTGTDIRSYGRVLNEVLDHLPTTLPRLRRIARKCESEYPYRSVTDVQMAVERRNSSQMYIFICVFIAVMVGLLIWFSYKWG